MDWDEAANAYWLSTPDGVGLESIPSEWQRELVALMLVNREVNNGGYLQFFVNHGRDGFEYASRALRAISARQMADIIDRCQAILDEHSLAKGGGVDERRRLVPNEIIGRDGQIIKKPGSVLPKTVRARISELSYEFMGYPDNVAELAQRHYGPLIELSK